MLEAQFNLGVVLYEQGRLDSAEAALRRATQIAPDHAESHVRFGDTIDQPTALEILKTFDKSELNILNTLGENFGVSDAWFSSVPSQTNSNRAFSIALSESCLPIPS